MKRILFLERKNYSFFKKHLALLTIATISIFSVNAQSLTALSFDGTDDLVTLPTNVLTRSYTKEAWVYYTSEIQKN